ncbi:MAG TPA: RecX family transcriptional regulator [Anaerolineales bacterium]|nr:RecX family transcriptional regulator [Anaerolineales bacterium]HLF01449.1 RecX family transcriptional regulator [Anaerolineales bacterium]
MPKVTALKIQARNKNRVNVYLDGEYAFGLIKIEAARLRVGQVLLEADIARLKQADEAESAYEKTLNFLAYRPRSEAEIRKYLKGKKLPEEQTSGVVARLRQAGLVDDEKFAEQWVENRATFRPKARRALKAELRAKGVGATAIEAAVAGVDEAAAARQLAAARAPRLLRQKLSRLDFKRKLGEYLARRGFNYEIITEAVERAWREGGGDNSDHDESED